MLGSFAWGEEKRRKAIIENPYTLCGQYVIKAMCGVQHCTNESLVTTLYTVALQESLDLPIRERTEAEVRFAKELERAVGGEDAVAEVYKAWLDVSESEANQIDSSTATKAVRRHRPADAGWVQQVGRHRRGAL